MTLANHIVEIIVGIVGVLGCLIILLNRFGLITFGKKEVVVTKEACPITKCPSHDDFVKKLNELSDAHILSHNLHKQHLSKFANGKDEFDAIKLSLKRIGENIAVLKDRSDREERRRGLDGL